MVSHSSLDQHLKRGRNEFLYALLQHLLTSLVSILLSLASGEYP